MDCQKINYLCISLSKIVNFRLEIFKMIKYLKLKFSFFYFQNFISNIKLMPIIYV